MSRHVGVLSSKLLAAIGVVVALSVATPVSAVPFILFTDLTEGAPSLTVAGIDLISTAPGPDTYSLTGTLHIPFGEGVLGLSKPSYTFVLLEADGSVSDIVTLTTPGCCGGGGTVDWIETIAVDFSSADGLTLPPGVVPDCIVTETGLVQTCHLFSQTGDNILDLQVQSDTDVPEPATLALLGLGLAGLGFSRRRRA